VRQLNHHFVREDTFHSKFLDHGGRYGAGYVDFLSLFLDLDDLGWQLVAHTHKVLVDNVA
jgi:hypothetical protein